MLTHFIEQMDIFTFWAKYHACVWATPSIFSYSTGFSGIMKPNKPIEKQIYW